jgi:hypothetical protein
MSELISDFEDRRRQVRHYLAIVLGSERATPAGLATFAQERRLLTLRAGTFLLFYNLIEASTRAAIDAIHDRILTDKEPFDRLIPSLRKEAVKRFKKHANVESYHGLLPGFPSAFVAVAMAESADFSGNVDAKIIRELGVTYGFSCITPAETWAGSDLVTIKAVRNDLSHGRKTFEEVGRDYPATELLAISRRAMPYMRCILGNVSEFLDEKHYLVA